MMGTCDSRGYFLDVEVKFPGSSSDFYAFLNSNLRKKLEMRNFLAYGLCLYGDNTYSNAPYMMVPFKGATNGAKDAFNYFHSSLRINIECAFFGMLVHRFGILRKPIPMNISVGKTTSLVMCLCKLHNFCINESESILTPLAVDVMNIAVEGGIAFPDFDNGVDGIGERVEELMDGGEHLEDVLHRDRRRFDGRNDLPVYKILEVIENKGYRRPEVVVAS
jgi:hypothetical protein